MNKIDIILEYIYLQEELPSSAKGYTEDKLKKIIKTANSQVNEKDPIGTMKKLQKLPLPKGSDSLFNKMAEKRIPNYKVLKNKAATVLKNSLPLKNEKIIDNCAGLITVVSIVAPKNKKNISHEKNMNDMLKKVVEKTRNTFKSYQDDEEKKNVIRENLGEVLLAFSVMTISLASAYGLITLVSAIIAGFTTGFFYWALFIFMLGLTVLLGTLKQLEG